MTDKPNSMLFSDSFWTRLLAFAGYGTVLMGIVWGVLLVVALLVAGVQNGGLQ